MVDINVKSTGGRTVAYDLQDWAATPVLSQNDFETLHLSCVERCPQKLNILSLALIKYPVGSRGRGVNDSPFARNATLAARTLT